MKDSKKQVSPELPRIKSMKNKKQPGKQKMKNITETVGDQIEDNTNIDIRWPLSKRRLDLIQKIGIELNRHGYALKGLDASEIRDFCWLEEIRLFNLPVMEISLSKMLEAIFRDGRTNVFVREFLINREKGASSIYYRFIPKIIGSLKLDWNAEEPHPLF
jgi:hypothetical protein